MSLLTKEQLKEIERLRAKLPGIESNVLAAQIGSLLSIIDDLQARSLPDTGKYWLEATPEQIKDELERGFHNGGDWEPDAIIRAHQLIGKQYTEQELRMEFRKRYSIRPGYEKSAFAPWIECAAFVGALKAEP